LPDDASAPGQKTVRLWMERMAKAWIRATSDDPKARSCTRLEVCGAVVSGRCGVLAGGCVDG
jgi:hypothetical protein